MIGSVPFPIPVLAMEVCIADADRSRKLLIEKMLSANDNAITFTFLIVTRNMCRQIKAQTTRVEIIFFLGERN